MNLQNEEIRVIQYTITQLKRAIPLEPNQAKREKMKKDVRELQSLIKVKLSETPDFADIVIEEDVY